MERNDRSIVGFTMVGHGLVHTYELSIPILMTIWLLEFSVTTAVLGGAVTVGYALFGAGALPGGLLADRYGSRPLICACLAGMGLSFAALALVPGIASLTAVLACWGIAASVYHPAGLALISNGVHERGLGFAYHGMAGSVGIAAGPLATALLLLAFDWRTVAVVLAVPALVAAAVGWFLRFDEFAAVEAGEREWNPRADAPDDSARGDSSTSPLSERLRRSAGALAGDLRRLFTPAFLTVIVLATFVGLYYRGLLTFLPDVLGDFLEAAVGDPQLFDPESPLADEFDLAQYLYVGLLTVGIAGQYVGGRLSDAIEPDRGLVGVLCLLVVISLAFVPAANAGLLPLLALSAVLGFALFGMQPLEQATIAKYSNPETRGLSFGVVYLALFGVGALGATVVGVALTVSVLAAFVVLAGFASVAAALGLSLRRRVDAGRG
ncbi:MFS transporter [Natronobiforma cellulositropha]|uniref:MFS transporter n=1 Tax=Natronobiforma cellulositropha TaxID=1679076 RepID=UPI003CCD3A8F